MLATLHFVLVVLQTNQLIALREEHDTVVRQVQTEAIARSDAETAAAQSRTEVQEFSDKLQKLVAEHSQCQSIQTKQKIQYERLQMETQTMRAVEERQTSQLNACRTELSAAKQDLTAVMQRHQQAEQQLTDAHAQANTQLGQLRQQMESEAAQLKEQVRSLESDVADLNDAVLELKAENGTLAEKLESAYAQIADVSKKFATSKEGERVLKQEVQQLQAKNASIEADYAGITTQCAAQADLTLSVRKTVEELTASKQLLQQRCDKLEKSKLTDSQLKAMMKIKEEHKAFKLQVAKLSQERDELSTKLSEAATSAALHASTASTSAASETKSKQLVAAQANLQKLKYELEYTKNKLEGENEDLKSLLEDATAKFSETSQEVAAKNEALAHLTSRYEQAQASQTKMLGCVAAVATLLRPERQEGAASSSHCFSRLIADLLPLSPPVVFDTTDHASVVAATRSVLEMIIPSFNAMQLKIDENAAANKADMQSLHQAKNLLQKEIADLKSALEEANGAMAELESNLHATADDYARAQGRGHELERMLNSTSDRSVALEKLNAELSYKAEERARTLAAAQEEHQKAISFLEKENLALMVELRALRTSNSVGTIMSSAALASGRVSVYSSAGQTGGTGGRHSVIAPSARVSTYAGGRVGASTGGQNAFAAKYAAAKQQQTSAVVNAGGVAVVPRSGTAASINAQTDDLLDVASCVAPEVAPSKPQHMEEIPQVASVRATATTAKTRAPLGTLASSNQTGFSGSQSTRMKPGVFSNGPNILSSALSDPELLEVLIQPTAGKPTSNPFDDDNKATDVDSEMQSMQHSGIEAAASSRKLAMSASASGAENPGDCSPQ
jgi:predicted  nucleic acid-binding Zn-ribbon protein